LVLFPFCRPDPPINIPRSGFSPPPFSVMERPFGAYLLIDPCYYSYVERRNFRQTLFIPLICPFGARVCPVRFSRSRELSRTVFVSNRSLTPPVSYYRRPNCPSSALLLFHPDLALLPPLLLRVCLCLSMNDFFFSITWVRVRVFPISFFGHESPELFQLGMVLARAVEFCPGVLNRSVDFFLLLLSRPQVLKRTFFPSPPFSFGSPDSGSGFLYLQLSFVLTRVGLVLFDCFCGVVVVLDRVCFPSLDSLCRSHAPSPVRSPRVTLDLCRHQFFRTLSPF